MGGGGRTAEIWVHGPIGYRGSSQHCGRAAPQAAPCFQGRWSPTPPSRSQSLSRPFTLVAGRNERAQACWLIFGSSMRVAICSLGTSG